MGLMLVILKVNFNIFSMKHLRCPSFAFSTIRELCTALTQKYLVNSAVFFSCFLCLRWQVKFCVSRCWGSGVPLWHIPQVLWLIWERENSRGDKSWCCCGGGHSLFSSGDPDGLIHRVSRGAGPPAK